MTINEEVAIGIFIERIWMETAKYCDALTDILNFFRELAILYANRYEHRKLSVELASRLAVVLVS